MRALILAGGFATRMGELGARTPKALLPAAGKPVIEHILERIEPLERVDEVFISTNKKFEGEFQRWMKGLDYGKKISLLVEPSTEHAGKLGSIGALNFFLGKKGSDEDLFVINGDNLFDFDLAKFMEFFEQKRSFVFGVYDTKSIEESRKMGVVSYQKDGRVTGFEEKPQNPKSTNVSTGIYIFHKGMLDLVGKYIEQGKNADRMGDFLAWLMGMRELYAFEMGGRWFDIGTPDTYKKADAEFKA
jgi:glucose-1-phosphate thymidylyltransferase